MSLSPPEFIRHMLDEIDYLQSRISNTDHDTFLKDETLKRAFVRSIEIIGEASKKLPENIKNCNLSRSTGRGNSGFLLNPALTAAPVNSNVPE